MTNAAPDRVAPLLRVLAFAQGIAIALLGVLLLRGDDVAPLAPAPLAPGDGPAVARPTPADSSGLRTRETVLADAGAPSPAVPAASAAAPALTGTVLYGRVTNAAGQAITNGVVWFTRADGTAKIPNLMLNERDPCFAIAGLAPGELAFQARATGYKETRGAILIPAGTPHLRHDIVLEDSWQLMVKILTPEGKPVHAALLKQGKGRRMLYAVEVGAVATVARPEGDFPLTALRELTFGVGRWRGARDGGMQGEKELAKDVTGVLELDSKQPLWISAVMRHRVLASVSVEPGQPEVTLVVGVDQVLEQLGTIRGRVVDRKTGQPITAARVAFEDQQSGGEGEMVDANGRFEVRDLRPGLLTLECYTESEKLTAPCGLVELRSGQVLDLGDVPLVEYRVIKGRCEGMVGKAHEARIACTALDPPPHPAMRNDSNSQSIGADGSFTLYLREGRHRLRASGAGGALVEIDTRTLGDEPLVLQLAKEAPLRVDVQSNGEPFELALFDGQGREVWRRDMRDGWKFSLPFLPGDYRVELKDRRGRVETRRIALGDAGADLRIP